MTPVLLRCLLVVSAAASGLGLVARPVTEPPPLRWIRIPWAGLTCPKGDMIGTVNVDGVEAPASATPQRAVAAAIAGQAPELLFDPGTATDGDPGRFYAEFALPDTGGHTVARFRAETDSGKWLLSGWTECSSVGGPDMPDPS
jgi:hypothetical protein